MNGDQTVNVMWGIGALILVVSALTARRISVGTLVRSVVGWLAIAAILFVIISNRDQIMLLAERVGLGDQEVVGDTVRIRQSPDGHFYANAKVNGVQVRMLVDSGATITALADATAERAGVRIGGGVPVMLTTANGTLAARRGTVETLDIGGLKIRDLGVVISPAFGDMNVIGMNFLSRLESWRVEGTTLVLEPKTKP